MFDFIKKIFQGTKTDAPKSKPEISAEDNIYEDEVEAKYGILLQETEELLHQHWNSIGKMEDDVLSLIVSPNFDGSGPSWPTSRQAYAVIRRKNSILVASNGLSWPEDYNAQSSGFGFEVFFETSSIDPHYIGDEGDVAQLKKSFAFAVILNIAEMSAENPSLLEMIEKYGAISTELPGVSHNSTANQIPTRFITDDDSLGVLIGAPEPDFNTTIPMPCGPVRLVPVTLLTANELDYIRVEGGKGRTAILEGLAGLPYEQRISLDRPDVTPQ